MEPFPSLEVLTALVAAQTGGFTALERISAAEELAEHLNGVADRLIGYYVEQARAEGYSWTEIGAHLGVSRQAAQQRYTPRQSSLALSDLLGTEAFARLTPRTRDALIRAEEHARRRNHDAVDAGHVLLALLDSADTLAAKVLERMKVPAGALRTATEALLPVREGQAPATIPVGAEGRRVLNATVLEALNLGHNYIGTEHVLLGLLHDEKSAASRVLRENGVDKDAARAAVQEAITEILRSRQ